MAAGTSSPDSPQTLPRPDGFGQVIEYDHYIETELSRTRRQVKGVDIATSCMLLAVAALVYLMLVALADHWLITGGLGRAARIAAFGLLAAGSAAFVLFRLAPLVLRRINPVYAAYTIERNRPGIKNSLINFLLLRSESQRLPERIYEAMEVQAANALTSTHAEVAVDRGPVIRLLMAMVGVVFFIALYAVLSPKNPFTSFRRVVSPWSDVSPPTRVAIREVRPGDGSGFHDQHVAVTAQIDGLRSGEAVQVRYSTIDGQVVGRAVPMTLPESSYRYSVELPPDNLGLQQDLEYWIEAGDAISPHYRIKVETSPTIVVEEIEYTYPEYSELPPRKVARHGDIQALAGTQVTLRAKANQLIREASLDFECDGRNDLDLRIDGTKADVTFPLVWNDKERRPEHESYQLRFRNADGHENPKPIRYSIEVIRDLPPEVELVEPELDPSKDLLVPPGKPVTFAVQAADPDFKLAAVKFVARRGGMALVDESLLAEPRGGQFQRAYVLDLKRLAVKPGEQIEFWAAADDNREPNANHSETPHYRLRVAAADKNEQNQQNQDQANRDDKRQPQQGKNQKNESGNRRDDNQQQGDQPGEQGEQQSQDKNQSGGKQNQKQQQRDNQSGDEGQQGGRSDGKGSDKSPSTGDKNQESDKQSGEGEGSSDSEKQGGKQDSGNKSGGPKRLDPERDAGRAIDEINKHFDQKEKQEGQAEEKPQQQPSQGAKKQEKSKNGGEEGAQQKEGDTEKQPADKQSPGKQPGDKQSASQPQSGDQKDDKAHSKQEQSQRGEGHDAQRPGEQSADDQKSESAQTGEKQQADQKSAKKQKPDAKDQNGALADKKNDKKPGAGEQGSTGGEAEKGDGEKQGQKQASKNGKQPSAGDNEPEGPEQGTANEGGEKSEKDKSGGGKKGEAKVGDEQEKNADGETKPRDGQGGQAKGPGERDDKVKKHKGESPDQKGGDPDSKDKGEGGAGDGEGANKHGAPSPHAENQQRDKKQMSPDSKKGTSEDEPESASDSKRQSDSQSGQSGDRDGGGKSGGGQRSNSEGTGSAGQNSEADQGGGKGETKGKGASGEKGGDQQKSEKPTGGKASGENGPGTNQGKGEKSDAGQPADSPQGADPRGHNNVSREPKADRDEQQPPGEKRQPKQKDTSEKKQPESGSKSDARQEGPQGERTPSDRGGHDLKGGKQRSNPTSGGQPGPDETTPPDEADNSEPGGEDPNLEYARKATDLALDRLKDQLAKGKPDPDLMKKLEWTDEDMKRFVEQWERLKKAADESGAKGDAARQDLDDALRSLGLSPHSTSLSGGQKREERVRNLEGRRTAPPPEFQEQWIEFNKATSRSGKR